MATTVQIRTLLEALEAGGETLRVEGDHTHTLTVGVTWSNTKILADADAGGDVVLYDATASGNPATWDKLAVFIDPDDDDSSALAILVEVRVGTTLLVFTVDRTAPLIFASQAADTAIPGSGAATSTINRIRAANNNADPGGGLNNDVKVRVVAFS